MKVFKRVIKVILGVVIVFVVGFGAMILIMNGQMKDSEEAKPVDVSTVKDGTYSGQQEAGPIAVKVQVTVQDKKITDINLVEHRNGLGSKAEAIVSTIKDKNTTDVDCISGATASSKTIKAAINNALTQGQ